MYRAYLEVESVHLFTKGAATLTFSDPAGLTLEFLTGG